MNINRDLALAQIKGKSLLADKRASGSAKPLGELNQKEAHNAKLKEACDGFEELFTHKLFQVMRESTSKTNLLSGGRGEEIFQDMLDENYAKLITKSGALGLSKMIYEATKES